MKKNGVSGRKELYKESILEGGHAEIENNNILYLYGNSFEVMLPDATFQNTIEIVEELKNLTWTRFILNSPYLRFLLNQSI